MHNTVFISQQETLKDSLKCVIPEFKTLLSLIPSDVQDKLSFVDKGFCDSSYVLLNEQTFKLKMESPPRCI